MSSKHTTAQSSRPVETRPAKRRKVDMPTADGFIASVPAKVKPVTVPLFVSAFDDKDSDKGKGKDKDVVHDRVVSANGRGRIGSGIEVMRRDRLGLGLGQKVGRGDAGPSLNASKALGSGSGLSDSVLDSSSTSASRSRRLDYTDQVKTNKEKTRAVSVLDVPMNISLVGPTKQRSGPQLHPAPPPQVIASASTSTVQPNLKQIVPPPFPNVTVKPSSKANSKPLQPPQPPAIPISTTTNKTKDLRAMSTTGLGLGLFSDPSSTQNGAEELAGILLRDQHPEILMSTREPHEDAQRGLDMSPDKKGKGKTKFVRGGLAARASAYFDRSLTAFVLWKKEVDRRPNTFLAEFCASVIKILHKPLHPARSSASAPGIALCRIRQQNGLAHSVYKADHLYRVVFSFPISSSTDTSGGSSTSLAQFTEGRTILVFRPWQEVSLRPSPDLDGEPLDVSDELPRLPASLPLPSPLSAPPYSTPDPLDAPIDETALVCSRFRIS